MRSTERFLVYFFTTGNIPKEWKLGQVTIIPKRGCTLYIDNLRPISQINIFMKLFEKLINTNLMKYLENNNILHINQGGFRKTSSTIETVSNLIGYISTAKNNKNSQYQSF